jgi:hypothetical protein
MIGAKWQSLPEAEFLPLKSLPSLYEAEKVTIEFFHIATCGTKMWFLPGVFPR